MAGQEQGTHHYVLTLEVPGYSSVTLEGTVTPPLGATRSDVYQRLRGDVTAHDARMAKGTVLFFSLEPNQL